MTAPYNRESFTGEGLRWAESGNPDFQPKLHAGMEAPDFTAFDLSGQPVRLSDFRGKKHVAFELGCITGPTTAFDVPRLNEIHVELAGTDVQVLLLYTREAHPGEHYGPLRSMEQKLAHARDLQRLEGLQFPVLVDTLDGEAHHAYGLMPNPVYVVAKSGRIAYKASWLLPDQLRAVLRQLIDCDQLEATGKQPRQAYAESLLSFWSDPPYDRVLARSGPKARADLVQALGFDPAVGPGPGQPKSNRAGV